MGIGRIRVSAQPPWPEPHPLPDKPGSGAECGSDGVEPDWAVPLSAFFPALAFPDPLFSWGAFAWALGVEEP